MYPGVNPQQLAAAQQLGKLMTGTITVDYKEGTVLLEIDSVNKDAKKAIPSMIESFSRALGMQLSSFFAINGKIVEKNKPQS